MKPLLLSLGAAVLLTFLFIEQKPVDDNLHDHFTDSLSKTRQVDSEINRDLLSCRYELLNSYDPFVRQLKELRRLANEHSAVPDFVGRAPRTEIHNLVRRESKLLSDKAQLIEQFKSENAILRNSSRYLPVLIMQASREASRVGDQRLREQLANLLRDILLYQLTSRPDLSRSLEEQLNLLSSGANRTFRIRAMLGSVVAHSRTIISKKTQVQNITEKLWLLPLIGTVERITSVYTREYDRSLEVCSIYRFLLYLSSVLLLAYGANRTASLVKSRIVLAHSNQKLNIGNLELQQAKAELQCSNRTLALTVEQLQTATERYELAVRGANDGLWDWDLTAGEMYYSSRWKEMLGAAPDELANVPQTWIDRLHPDDRNRVQEEWNDHLANRSSVFESEHRMLHNDGAYRWMKSRGMAVRGPDGRAQRMAGSQTDITGNKSKDPLTGLANRLLFSERISQMIRDSRRSHLANYAVFFLDVDRFKVVNDSLGHLAGDILLRKIADRLRECVRSSDTVCGFFGDSMVARLGGDEFAILLEHCSHVETARLIADRVLTEFARPIQVSGRDIVTTFSVGVAIGNLDYFTPDDVLRDADIAMYEAKVAGKARVGVFNPGMRERAMARMEMEADIRIGIETGQFAVYYQPKVDMRSDKIVGFEALVRWNHPKRGLVSPGEFIPIAEETGLIVPLGYWVLNTACSQMKEWQKDRANANLTVSVNISGRQFAAEDFVERVGMILRDSGMKSSSLDLELTESVVMVDPVAASRILRELKDLGIGLDMDDFGTGYSSLSYLQQFPFDTIKIDRSFVMDLDNRAENRNLIRTIVHLANNFKMKVVAEGIETALHSAELKALGCHYGQGYFFSKPVTATTAGEMIRTPRYVAESAKQVCFA